MKHFWYVSNKLVNLTFIQFCKIAERVMYMYDEFSRGISLHFLIFLAYYPYENLLQYWLLSAHPYYDIVFFSTQVLQQD